MISAWTQSGRIMASYRKAGALTIRDIGPALYAGYVRDPLHVSHNWMVERVEVDHPGWYRVVFPDYDCRKEALRSHRDVLFEADVSPVRRFLTDHHCKIDAPKRAYIDLETDSRCPFTEAVQGGTTILSWALVDENGAVTAHVLEDDDDRAEAELLASLWEAMGRSDQIMAWNGDGFDFPVILKRSEILAKKFSRTMQPYWEHRRRLLFLDHLACFRRHHMAATSGDDKTSFALNSVAQALLGEGKTDFESSKTWEAWQAGGARRQELLAYNIQDTALLPKLEAKTGYLELQQTLAEVTLTFANSHGLKPSPQIDGYLLKMAHARKTHLPSKLAEGGAELTEAIEGAFVLKPTSLGIHRDVHVCDFKSLYPTVLRTFNISPETKGHVGGAKAFGTDAEYDTAYEGMIPAAAREAMELRSTWNKKYKADPNDKSAERKSKAYKIFNNSIYGYLGNIYARFFDPVLVESVTLSAKHLNMQTTEAARAKGWEVIYMDTDSLFVKGCSVDEFQAFVQECNRELYPKLLATRNVSDAQRCIELDYEKCFERLVFPLGSDGVASAKRYAGSFRHYAFKPRTAPEIRGLEYMRTDSVRLARRWQKEIIDMILAGKDDPEEFHAWVRERRAAFFERAVELEDIVLSKSLSRPLDQYKSRGPHVRIAETMAAGGEDVSEGTRVSYVVLDSETSPTKVAPASEFDGVTFDRWYYWTSAVYPPIMRVLAGAFPNQPWSRWIPKRPHRVATGQLSLGLG